MKENLKQIAEKARAAGGGAEGFELLPEESLSAYTSFCTGGKATVLLPGTEAALLFFVPRLAAAGIPVFLLGAGTNVLARDEGYNGVILCTKKLRGVERKGNTLVAAAGEGITHLAAVARQNALSGLEFAYGIPGSVGGAIYMNAGAYDGEVSAAVQSVRAFFPDRGVVEMPASECGFGYRESAFQKNGGIVLSAAFSLRPGDPEAIGSMMEDLMGRRREKQPLEYPSAGSTFKRYPGTFTAKLIDEAGLKGKRVGGAMVSEKHAGFIINYDRATSRDILDLVALVQKTIYEKNGIRIEKEIRIIE